jgi:hypothetical protein
MSHQSSFRNVVLVCLAVLGGSLSVGCNRGPRIVPARGVVVFEDGSPVHVGTVETKSLKYENVQSTGKIQNDGTFVLSTLGDGDGAAVGEHQCVVVQLVMAEGIEGHRTTTEGIVDRKFNTYSTSGLRIQVPDEGTKDLKLVVKGIAALPGEKKHTDHTDESDFEGKKPVNPK